MEKLQTIAPKQMEFLRSKTREILLSGAFGSGKSWAVCFKTIEHALIPGNLVLRSLLPGESHSLSLSNLHL